MITGGVAARDFEEKTVTTNMNGRISDVSIFV